MMAEHEEARPVVVLLEDDPQILMTLVRQVRRLLPHCALVAGQDGGEVLAQLSAQPIVLAVVDYYLRERNGLTLVATLKAQALELRTILITASPTHDVVLAAREAGVDIVLPKPFLLEELEQAIWSLLPDERG